jgi:beta-N-acetylhexosaminidase
MGRDIVPYRLLRTSLPMIMVGHACYPALQGKSVAPASLSHTVVSDCLRREIGYRGLILTDDLEMGAIETKADGATRARAAFAAGHDGLMFCQSAERIGEAHEALIRGLERGELDPAEVRARLRRIERVKNRFLVRRHRPRYSAGGLKRAHAMFALLDPAAHSGFDPTERT